jgi:acetoin utilization deacetylase AcuC-like enzyme
MLKDFIGEMIESYGKSEEVKALDERQSSLIKELSIHSEQYLSELKKDMERKEPVRNTDKYAKFNYTQAAIEYHIEEIRQRAYKAAIDNLGSYDDIIKKMKKEVKQQQDLLKSAKLAIRELGENVRIEV